MRISKAWFSDLEILRSFAERTFRIAFEQLNDPIRFEKYCEEVFSPAQFRREM